MTTPPLTIRVDQEYADLVPKMSAEDYESFKQSIKEHGQLVPIIVNQTGVILDGHHRYRACRELGIECRYEIKNFGPDDQLEEKLYVINTNERRNLNRFQKIVLVLLKKRILHEIATRNMLKGELLDLNKSRVDTNKELGKLSGYSKDTVRKVDRIQNEAPTKYLEKVRSGAWSINATYKKMDNDQKIQKLIDAAPAIDLPDTINLYEGDFMKISHKLIPDNSIDLIITDPPYTKQSVSIYKDLGIFAARVLKDGGSLAVIAGHEVLLKCGNYIEEAGLHYGHILSINHSGSHSMIYKYDISVFFKPLLLFFKGDKPNQHKQFNDVIHSNPPKKQLHNWEQSPIEAEHMITGLTVGENQIVCDPCMGPGTFGKACIKLNRKFIGIEIDPKVFEVVKANIATVR